MLGEKLTVLEIQKYFHFCPEFRLELAETRLENIKNNYNKND